MSLTSTIATAVAAAATVGFVSPPLVSGASAETARMTSLTAAASALPQLAAASIVCDGKTLRRTVVRAVAGPVSVDSVTSTETQSITTTKSQGSTELLVVTFGGTVIKYGANMVAAAIRVDGTSVAPTDQGYSTVLDSASWASSSVTLTRCLRVRPGKHQVSVSIGANLGGPAFLREYTIRIDQYN